MFKKYTSIENSFQKDYLEKMKASGFWKAAYVVQEKAHGANLSFWTSDGKTFQIAKRTGLVEENESFYGVQNVAKKLQINLEALWEKVLDTYPEMTEMAVFGELIGGVYPHPEVPKNSAATMVQKGVCYTPNNEFFGFDIKVNGEYLPVEQAIEWLNETGFLYAKILLKGSIEEVLAYPNKFDSTIPAMLGLPPLKDNVCEGVVIKPTKTLRLPNGARVVLKNKNEKWSEKTKVKKNKVKVNLPPHILEAQAILESYITENRYHNVVSKIGEVTRKDFSKVMGLFSQDMLADFEKENQTLWDGLEKTEKKQVTKAMAKKVARIINENIQLDW